MTKKLINSLISKRKSDIMRKIEIWGDSMRRYKAIIFDIDNTLLDTIEMNVYTLMRIIKEELGEDRTFQQLLCFMAQPGLKTIEDLGIRDKEKTYARWVSYVNSYGRDAVPFEGIEGVLRKLQTAGMRMAIVSSKMKAQYKIDIVGNGLDRYMETAVLVEDTEKHKPHPDPIFKCLERMGLSAQDVLYVGDAPMDMQAAQAAGVDFGFARWGYTQPERMTDARYCFICPEELLQLI